MEGFEFRKIALLGSLYGMVVLAPASAMADNGGLSFWLPGTSAVPAVPGWASSGPGAKLGEFKGRVAGIGPQIGFLFPVSESYNGYLNLKGYKDFAAENRPEGWTAWVTLAISPAPLAPAPKPMYRK